MIKITMEGTVRRVYSEERNGFTNNYVVVSEPANNQAGVNVLRFRSKDPASAGEGDRVKVEAFVDGREWDGRDGKVYFTDLNLAKLEVVSTTEKPKVCDPQYAATGKSALKAYMDHGGEQKNFGLFCRQITGKTCASKEYTNLDWLRVIGEACAPKAAPEDDGGDPDDLPF